MKPYYQHAGITIYHGDCREILPLIEAQTDLSIGAIVTDPPYGINHLTRINNLDSPWKDAGRVDLQPWIVLAEKLCIWGGNYYTDQLPASETWLIWLKRPAGFDRDSRVYSVLEMAWTNYGGKPRQKTHVWDGGKRQGAAVNREFYHAAQKPLEIMRWSISEAGEINGSVVDPFMGSGTTLEAAKELNYRAIGIEIEERYCEIAAKRLSQEVLKNTDVKVQVRRVIVSDWENVT